MLDAGLTTSSIACSYSYLLLPTLLPSLLKHHLSPGIAAASTSVLPTAYALSSDYCPTKIDWNWLEPSLNQVYFPDTSATLLDIRFIDMLDNAFRFEDNILELPL